MRRGGRADNRTCHSKIGQVADREYTSFVGGGKERGDEIGLNGRKGGGKPIPWYAPSRDQHNNDWERK